MFYYCQAAYFDRPSENIALSVYFSSRGTWSNSEINDAASLCQNWVKMPSTYQYPDMTFVTPYVTDHLLFNANSIFEQYVFFCVCGELMFYILEVSLISKPQ